MSTPLPTGRWSCYWECCQKCGTEEKVGKHIHKGRGLCLSCFDKERSRQPKRRLQLKKQCRRRYEEFRKRPDYKELCRKKQKEWALKNPALYKATWHRNHLKERFVRFIKSPAQHEYKKYAKALNFYCEDCETMVQTCILPDCGVDAEMSKTGRELGYFKKVHEEFCQKKTINYGDFIKL